MDDAEFLSMLEAATLAPADFNHRAHVRAGFLILGEAPSFGAALDRMERAIRHFAKAHGKEGLYHETITVAFMALINARRVAQPFEDWPAFATANPDLFEPGLLDRYYPKGFLASPAARAAFHLPEVRGAA
ncbi:MAG: hypothetical protein KDJ88_08245 [Bauldia sp.]|nr:hypothetical protein [Bauldia sp.]